MTTREGGNGASTTARATLTRIRTERPLHLLALLISVGLGLALSWLHWIGLVVGGVLVGLVARNLPKALGYGLGFGLVVLVVFAFVLGSGRGPALEMAPAIYLTVGAALGLPILGSLARGIV
ncbi:hypothetical protein [Natronosalvus rutilus]|uniref:Uncharacterized protein n=1 Tax=Natronosalvus rutilus TaxID=2953753 RepID=A0A9E7N735_9EURY|nr:hypothetical protein [Natronosalvus rutilus]UTF52919.1 hypothetical protein NGM29_14195 [Natronosalvus rutilus]